MLKCDNCKREVTGIYRYAESIYWCLTCLRMKYPNTFADTDRLTEVVSKLLIVKDFRKSIVNNKRKK